MGADVFSRRVLPMLSEQFGHAYEAQLSAKDREIARLRCLAGLAGHERGAL